MAPGTFSVAPNGVGLGDTKTFFRGQTKIRLAVNNLFDSHSITGVSPASTKTSVAAPGDVLTLMAARSVSLSFSVGFSPARP